MLLNVLMWVIFWYDAKRSGGPWRIAYYAKSGGETAEFPRALTLRARGRVKHPHGVSFCQALSFVLSFCQRWALWLLFPCCSLAGNSMGQGDFMKDGTGLAETEDGVEYEGTFQDGEPQGPVTLFFPDGTALIGRLSADGFKDPIKGDADRLPRWQQMEIW
jgi:hypothetical protein